MKQIIVKASINTFVSIAASVSICAMVLTWMGSRLDSFAIVLSAVCPLVLAFPLSFYTHRQQRKLERAHAALAAAHASLADQARHDDLTGLLNRSAFIAAVDTSQAASNRGSMLLIDADDFKAINDSHGHVVGDKAVCAIAHAIRDAVDMNAFVARIGGDEFTVFFPLLSVSEARIKAEHIRRAVEMLNFCGRHGEPIALTVSIGAVEVAPGATFPEILEAADEQLYRAKNLGRNTVAAPQFKIA